VHNGHLVAARAVLEALSLDEVLFVPAGNQWQKTGQTTAVHRLEMTKLAVAGQPGFAVSSIDVDRDGATYTVDTIRLLAAQNPDAKLFFILGTDALAGLASWREAETITELAQFVVVTRPGSQLHIPAVAQGRVWVLEIEALNLSSTELRAKLAAGADVSGQIPEAVLRYIVEQNLYREVA